jgi:hypothetical protein
MTLASSAPLLHILIRANRCSCICSRYHWCAPSNQSEMKQAGTVYESQNEKPHTSKTLHRLTKVSSDIRCSMHAPYCARLT